MDRLPAAIPSRPVLRYHGGKWRMAPWIIEHFPPHKTYVEPFCGAASVLLRKPPSPTEVLNDQYDRVVNLFRVLRNPDQAARLRESLRYTAYAEAEYLEAREIADDPVEDARRLIVLGHQAHGSTGATGGKLSGWRRGIRDSSSDSASEWADLYAQVEAWANRLRGVFIEHDHAFDVIQRWDAADTLFYVDPPYVAETRTSGLRGYRHEMEEEDHRRLADLLRQVKGMVVLSGYASPLYDELYPGWERAEREVLADKGRRAVEVLWLSPNVCNARWAQLGLL